MKNLTGLWWTLGIAAVVSVVVIIIYRNRNKNKNPDDSNLRPAEKCCTKRDANCHCIEWKWVVPGNCDPVPCPSGRNFISDYADAVPSNVVAGIGGRSLVSAMSAMPITKR